MCSTCPTPLDLTIKEACRRYARGKTRLNALIRTGRITARKDRRRTFVETASGGAYFNGLPPAHTAADNEPEA